MAGIATTTRTRILALAGFAALLLLASLLRVTLFAGPDQPDPDPRGWVVALVFTAIGARVASRHPRNGVAWLLLAVGVSGAIALFSASYAGANVALAWVSQWAWWPGFGLQPLVLLLFPDGRLPSNRWRVVAWLAVGGLVIPTLALALAALGHVDLLTSDVNVAEASGSQAVLLSIARLALALTLVAGIAAVISLILRYRRALPDERQQLKWLLAAGVLVLVAGILQAVWEVPGASLVGAAAIPVAVGVAILRYRLYEIDRLISRTVTYVLLTGVLGAIYATGVVLLRPLLRPVTGESELAVAASTLVVAAAFGPARRRIQQAVDRRFYRTRLDAAHTVETFGARLRDELDLDDLAAELLATVRSAVQPAGVSLWLRQAPR